MALRRDAVVGYEVAQELMIASNSDVDSVVGTSEVVGWKRSGCLVSCAFLSAEEISLEENRLTKLEQVMNDLGF